MSLNVSKIVVISEFHQTVLVDFGKSHWTKHRNRTRVALGCSVSGHLDKRRGHGKTRVCRDADGKTQPAKTVDRLSTLGGGEERERERQTDRDRDRQTDRQRQTDRERQRQWDRERERERELVLWAQSAIEDYIRAGERERWEGGKVLDHSNGAKAKHHPLIALNEGPTFYWSSSPFLLHRPCLLCRKAYIGRNLVTHEQENIEVDSKYFIVIWCMLLK